VTVGEDEMEPIPIVEKIKSRFKRHDVELEYLADQSRFAWCGAAAAQLPTEHGVYCLFSHNDTRVQKIGKAEAKHGLLARLSGYTSAKTVAKIESDKTDQRWQRVMRSVLEGERLSLFYFPTVPQIISSPIYLDEEPNPRELECHWARSLEKYLYGLVRAEYKKRNVLDTHLLLSGLGD
jgi:hypothetical protein